MGRITQTLLVACLYFLLGYKGVAYQGTDQLLDLGFGPPVLQYRLALRVASRQLNLILREEAGGYHGNEQDIRFAQAMVSMGQSLGDSWLMLVGFHYWGNIELYQAKYPAALDHSKAALRCLSPELDVEHPATIDFPKLARIDTKNAAALQLDEIAVIYTNWQKFDSAFEYATAVITLLRLETPQNPALLANALDLCSTTRQQQGQWDQALKGFQAAREILLSALNGLSPSDRVGAADAKLVLADTLRAIGYIKLEHRALLDRKEALADFDDSLRLSKELSTPYEIAEGDLALATYYYETDEDEKALRFANDAAALANPNASGNNSDALWKALSIQGNCLVRLGHPEKAEETFRQAVDIIEAMRSEAGADRSLKSSFYDSLSWFFAEKVGPYIALAELLAAEGKTAEALTYAELSRQRALLDSLTQGATGSAKSLTSERWDRVEITARFNA
ncbi:MAG: hypothetical protein JO333_20370 [Verrucomicrobia bacterium]|nr:hypothetical protein [Verrucomicrobiota bacterium]